MKKYDIRLLTGFFWVVLTGIWVGCTEDRPYEDVVKRQNVSLELCLTTPGLMFSNTRSMSAAQESENSGSDIRKERHFRTLSLSGGDNKKEFASNHS